MIDSRVRYLFNNTVVFAISNFGTKLISFFLVPLYTYTLTVSDYGVADLVTTVTFVLAPMLTLNLSDAVMRFPLDGDSNPDRIISVGLFAIACATGVGLLVIPAASLFPSIAEYSVFMYSYCIATAVFSMMQAFLRGLEELRAFAVSNILNTALTALLNIAFLVVLDWGVSGYLLAYIISMIVSSMYAGFKAGMIRRFANLRFDLPLFKEMAKYAVVLIPNTFMWWIINSSSRVVVTAMLGTVATGMIAVAYKLPSIISVLSNTFTQAWSYSAIREDGSSDCDEFTSRVFDRLVVAAGIITVLLLAGIKWITELYVSPAYAEVWKYSTWLILGNLFLTLGSFLGASYSVHKDSMGYLVSGTIGAIVNLLLMFTLIPLLGLTGSVIASCLSYFVVFVYRFFDTRKYVSIRISLRKHIPMVVSIVVLMTMSSLTGDMNPIAAAVMVLVVLCSYGSSVYDAIRSRGLL